MLLRFLKNWTLPVAIAVGVSFYLLFACVPTLDEAGDILSPIFETLLPLTIFLTLFVTFSKVDFSKMRLRRWHISILTAQLVLVGLLTALILHTPSHIFYSPYSKYVLEAVLVCVIAPCASASPVVTAKLDGDLTQMTTFVLLSSVVASVLISAIFPLIEPPIIPQPSSLNPHPSTLIPQPSTLNPHFLTTFLLILRRLATILLLPLLLGAVVRHWAHPLHNWFLRHPDLGFYLWSCSLAITSGITMRNIVTSHAGSHLFGDIAVAALVTALVQFAIGRFIGRHRGEKICTGQAMFQKNTGLAIWIAYTYLTPEGSIGAGCYVLWQNLINSYELWQHRHHRP